ncbi:MAG: pantoate--beta-alanine ligase [Nitrospiraceae bacterium]|nr:pantoate--beta-alanine ligase [Nitrospiraceae bacterium]
MQIIRTVRGISAWSRSLHREGVMIGLVPTMGALHHGHGMLIRTARIACDAVAVSLFVNPRQFGPSEDFFRYPRRFKEDAALCRREGVDVLFAPSPNMMYPPGFQTSVMVRQLSHRWEGAHRPGHFDGVATVVTKLISLVRPDKTFFGQKDYQQAVMVKQLVADLNLGAQVAIHPTVREPDGLAMSSRNVYLTAAQRRVAPILYRALQAGRDALKAGVRSGARIRRVMANRISAEPSVRIDYLAVCDAATLEPLTRVTGKTVLLGAIRLGRIRLIDNVLVNGVMYRQDAKPG